MAVAEAAGTVPAGRAKAKRGVRRSTLIWLLAAALSLAATWPAAAPLFRPGYLSTFDGVYHLTRMIEVDSMVRDGVLYPRWLPDFGQGHGLPLFNFFPPFAYLLTEIFQLALNNLPLAIQVSMAASFFVAAAGLLLFVREAGAGPVPAVIAAVFYGYFPYHVQDAHARGGMPELWAIALLPWLAYAQIRTMRSPWRGWLPLAALLAAIEVGTHNVIAIFALPVALLWSLALGPRTRRSMLKAGLASGFGLLLSAGYWLPGVVESGLTNLKQLQGDWLPRHVFGLLNMTDAGFFAQYGQGAYRMTNVQALMLVGLLVILGLQLVKRQAMAPAGLAIASSVAFVLLMTPLALPFWLNAPLANYVQFPWRMLILLGFTQAATIGISGAWSRLTWLPLAAVVGVMAYSTLAHVPDGRFSPPIDLAPGILETQEYGSSADGVTIESEYQPRTSSVDVLKAGVGRFAPADATQASPLAVTSLSVRATTWQAEVEAPAATVLRLQQFYFAGWRATIDGRTSDLSPATPAGLIELAIPAGRHLVQLRYAGTVTEGLAGLVSALTLAALLGWALMRRRLALVAVAPLFTLAVLLVLRPPAARSIRPLAWSSLAGETLVAADPPEVRSGQVDVDLYWLFSSAQDQPFDFVLTDAGGREVARVPAASAAVMPDEYLAVNELVRKRYSLRQLPAGRYQLSLAAAGASVALGQVLLPGDPRRRHPLEARFEDKAILLDYAVDRLLPRPTVQPDDLPGLADATLRPGDFFQVSLRWRSLGRNDRNWVTFVHLLDADGRPWATHDNQPDATFEATTSWVPGKIIPDDFVLQLRDDAPPGLYRLEVGMYNLLTGQYEFLHPAGGGNSILFGSVKVRPAQLPPAPSLVAQWREPIGLAGWHSSPNGHDLDLTFDWYALGTPSRDYTLFVQLIDGGGAIAAQADAPPQHNVFPTHLWELGDRISDVHLAQEVPPGRYRLVVGWYRPDAGERVPLEAGGDAYVAGEVQVQS